MCGSKPNHAIKTIRVENLEYLETLMRRGVKIIQVIRDPRATVLSRGLLHQSSQVKVMMDSMIKYCDRRLSDLMYVKHTFARYNVNHSDVIYYLRYEELATNPIRTMVDVYTFLGIEPDDNVIGWAVDVAEKNLNVTADIKNGGMRREGRYSTLRSDPAYTAQAWRQIIPWDALEYIQDHCADFLYVFGYTLFNNEQDLLNFEIPTLQTENDNDNERYG